MTFIFLDTSYLQALANPGDDLTIGVRQSDRI